MKGSEERFVRFMEGSKKRFVIPVYQRNYDWKIEHCKQLYDDLIKVARQGRKSHFFGSIVSVYNPDGHQDEFQIIDGQQRLTTVSLLFLAMYNLIRKATVVPQSTNLGEQLYEVFLIDKWQPQDTRIKLRPIKSDQLAFERLFDPGEDRITDSNITINYTYFYERVLREEISIDELFDAVSKLEIINITLNQDDNPQLIFESLNSTGLDLSEGDKIRNYVLMGLPTKQQEAFYEKYWSKIEYLSAFDVSAFVRDYLSVKQQSTPAISNVYFKFKEYVEDSEFSDIEIMLADLLQYAKKYEFLIKANTPWVQVNECIGRLNRVKTTVSRPFFMEIFRMKEEEKITNSELLIIFQAIENYVFRRNICDVPTNALNKIFLMLHNEIVRLDGTDANYFEKFKFILINKKESARFPDDEEFTDSLSVKNIYSMRGESKHYLFERLENVGTVETKDVYLHLDKGEYSIEHIMPQQLTTKWANALGEESERIHLVWLHRLANLTLTAYNSKYSNLPFEEKREMENGFKQSGLRMNQWIGQQSKWGEPELEERDRLIQAASLKIWPHLESSYNPPQKQFDTVTLDDDMVFTGKGISRFSLGGLEQSVDSWTDMYQRVLIQLHSEDKSILTRLAVCEDNAVDLSIHFSTDSSAFTSGREIDGNIFVWTGTDTQYKINILKKMFSLFDIDPTELVFYLRDDSTVEADESGRHAIRKKYWAFLLPSLREVTGIFNNVNPSRMNWINGYPGYSGIHVSCVANFDSARVELYLEMPSKERNKELFDFLHSRKDFIETNAHRAFNWVRNDDAKSSKILLTLNDVSVSNEADWQRMSRFHMEGCRVILESFGDLLTEYFS